MPEDQQIATEGGLNADNLEAVREELSGGFTKHDGARMPTTPVEDQQQGEDTGASTTTDSIGLSGEQKPPADDASDGGGEASGDSNTDSAATPIEDDDSPFSTEEDDVIENNTEEELVDNTEYFEELSNQIGYDVASEEDLVSLVRELSVEKDPLEGLSPLLKQAAEFESNGGDVREYFNVLSINTDNLSDKDAMWHKFKAENSSLAQENGDFAKQKFDRDFKTKYKILSDDRNEDDFDTIEEYQSFLKDKEYASLELKYEADLAKQFLTKGREEALASAPPQAQVNEEEQRQIYDAYKQDADYYKSNFDTLQIPIDKDGKTNYNIGLNEKSRPMFEEWMDDPSKFLDYIGIGSDQKTIDVQGLAAHMALTAAFAVEGEYSVGAQFAKAMTERVNRNSIETRLENPAPEGGKATSGVSGGNELSEAIEAFRNDVIQRRR